MATAPLRNPNSPRPGRPVALRPLAYDPFTGDRFEFKSTPGQGGHIARTKKYFFGPFKTKGELLVAISTRDGVAPKFTPKQAEKLDHAFRPPGLSNMVSPVQPLVQCPFTGKRVAIELEDIHDPAGRWIIRGDKYMICGFPTKRAAEHFFSTRNGNSPNFNISAVEVTRAEGDLPPETDEETLEGMDQKGAQEISDKLKAAGIGSDEIPTGN